MKNGFRNLEEMRAWVQFTAAYISARQSNPGASADALLDEFRKRAAGLRLGQEEDAAGPQRNPATGFGGPRGTSMRGAWLALAEAEGGVHALAKALGITPNTLYRWSVKGAEVLPTAKILIAMLAEKHKLPSPVIAGP